MTYYVIDYITDPNHWAIPSQSERMVELDRLCREQRDAAEAWERETVVSVSTSNVDLNLVTFAEAAKKLGVDTERGQETCLLTLFVGRRLSSVVDRILVDHDVQIEWLPDGILKTNCCWALKHRKSGKIAFSAIDGV